MGTTVRPVIFSETDIRREIEALEARHAMSSADFLVAYTRGELGDAHDFTVWSALCDMLAHVQATGRQRP